jgi:hypothetical protein
VSRAKAHQILSQAQFKGAQPGSFQKFLDWVFQHLPGFGGSAGNNPIAWAILIAFVAGVAVVIWRVTRTVQHDPAGPDAAAVVERRQTPAQWSAEAAALEADGRWKEGLRCRYRGLVASLIARDAVRDLPGRTTGEHRADVREALPEARSDFDEAAELFERAWYGDRPTGPDESARFASLADKVVARR